MSLRPSNLPKLAECACYESDPKPGPAAERGSALDAVFRSRLAGAPDQVEMFYHPTEHDLVAVDWAVTTLRALAGGSEVITREADCRIQVPGIDAGGTADALILEKCAHADLKTGQPRNYREQMAAYALGLMEQHFASEWTAYVLFCDQKEVVTQRFTFDEARRIVNKIAAKYRDPAKRPTPCDYCGWCAKEQTCEARLALAGNAVAVAEPGFDFELIVADNAKLGRFLSACSVLDDYREKAEAAAKERIQAGADVPGWKIGSRRGPEFVDHVTVGLYLSNLGHQTVLAAYGSLSAKKFREIWEEKRPGVPFPEEAVKHGKASISLRQTTKALPE